MSLSIVLQSIQHYPGTAGRSNDLQQCDRSQQFTVAPDYRGQLEVKDSPTFSFFIIFFFFLITFSILISFLSSLLSFLFLFLFFFLLPQPVSWALLPCVIPITIIAILFDLKFNRFSVVVTRSKSNE
ncbi:hypothetical protein BO94DRAFT_371200 [Aspergillus sclerotioniger CBS 115572]|uniref:Uncharacterized protein n=1 Tax=Aspergillus sclerotioniger CBS 115572 TaxID=1450535 RepID=A0A317X6P6_9EURO|nr:hypothetical protein BO94DRAFT_371200 [Aspergillus sclerotioniger CBS 115572]PWY93322.1 hypothetical protein BO94DRAFT_371200 [Aspergillus sclerotioniger CBS 115572]